MLIFIVHLSKFRYEVTFVNAEKRQKSPVKLYTKAKGI